MHSGTVLIKPIKGHVGSAHKIIYTNALFTVTLKKTKNTLKQDKGVNKRNILAIKI